MTILDPEFAPAVAALTDFAAKTRFEDLPAPMVERLCVVLADEVASIAAGNQTLEVRALAQRQTPVENGVAIIGTPLRCAPRDAALVNGTAGTTFEIDEGNRFARGHPGIHVVPCGLATAEALGLSPRDLITALAVGYDIGARIGAATRLRPNMQSHGTWGAIGAAVTVARLRGFDAKQMRDVIDVASCLGLGSNIHAAMEGGTVRNVYAGVGNAMGLLAADLVQSGYTGGASSLGIVYGTILSSSFQPGALTDGLGTRWEIMRNYFKIHACCRHMHGVADNTLKLLTAHPELARVETIISVEVESYAAAAEMTETDPINTTAAKFSAPFVVATTLVHGIADLPSFAPAAMADPRVKALARKVRISERPEMTAQQPQKRPSRVVVTLADGRRLTAETEGHKGDPEDPHDATALERKFLDLTTPVWGADAAKLRVTILTLPTAASLAPLFALLGRGPA